MGRLRRNRGGRGRGKGKRNMKRFKKAVVKKVEKERKKKDR